MATLRSERNEYIADPCVCRTTAQKTIGGGAEEAQSGPGWVHWPRDPMANERKLETSPESLGHEANQLQSRCYSE